MPINSRGGDTFHQALITYSRADERGDRRARTTCESDVYTCVCACVCTYVCATCSQLGAATVIDNNASPTSTLAPDITETLFTGVKWNFSIPKNENYNGKRAADKPRVRSRNRRARYIDEKFEVQIIETVESYGKRRVHK